MPFQRLRIVEHATRNVPFQAVTQLVAEGQFVCLEVRKISLIPLGIEGFGEEPSGGANRVFPLSNTESPAGVPGFSDGSAERCVRAIRIFMPFKLFKGFTIFKAPRPGERDHFPPGSRNRRDRRDC